MQIVFPLLSVRSFCRACSTAAYYDAIGWAVANGITAGTGNGKFGPMDECDRGMMITFLHRLFIEDASV